MSKRRKVNVKKKNDKALKNFVGFTLLFPLLLTLFIFLFSGFVNQQSVLSQQDKDLKYYNAQKKELEDEKKELENQLSKIDSNEYIENIAREKLNLYYSNEVIYVDASYAP